MAKRQPKKVVPHFLGTHLIAEFFGCRAGADMGVVRRAMKEAAIVSGATILDETYHEFIPQGLTGYVLLKESHISIHTWPEYQYAAIDVFTCGAKMRPKRAVAHLKKILKPKEVTMQQIMRGEFTLRPTHEA